MSSEAEVALVWQPGDVILDLYEVRDVVVSGGMGLVYRVLHRGWNAELAVKAPRQKLVDSPIGVRNFEAEAEAWVGLGLHPHTVNCVYVRRLGGLPRVFAEWVDGGSLADAVEEQRIYQGGPQVALRRILDVAIQCAWGLEHAHQHGLIHQDVKPANVMLTRDGTVKVTDFGLAKARAAAGESTVGRPGMSLLAGYSGWTPEYGSPEQGAADAGQAGVVLTRATDVWSWAPPASSPPRWAGASPRAPGSDCSSCPGSPTTPHRSTRARSDLPRRVRCLPPAASPRSTSSGSSRG